MNFLDFHRSLVLWPRMTSHSISANSGPQLWRRARRTPKGRVITQGVRSGLGRFGALLSAVATFPSTVALEGSFETNASHLSEAAYWDALYSEEPKLEAGLLVSAWQGVGFDKLQDTLQPLLKAGKARVLVLGCGDSPLPEELMDAGAANVTGVDFSTKAVTGMAARGNGSHPGISRVTADVVHAELAAGAFDVAVDVGVLDVLVLGEKDQAEKMLAQVHWALRPNGTYISVSPEPPAFRQSLLDGHPAAGAWSTVVEEVPRPLNLDPRLLELDPEYTVGSLSVYISRAVYPEADKKVAEELEAMARTEVADQAVGKEADQEVGEEELQKQAVELEADRKRAEELEKKMRMQLAEDKPKEKKQAVVSDGGEGEPA